MELRRNSGSSVLAIGLVLALLAGCGGGAATAPAASSPGATGGTTSPAPSGQAEAIGSVVVAAGADGGFSTVIAPVLEGAFERQGIDATLRLFPSTPEIIPAMLTGDVDITLASEATLLLAKAQGGAIHVVQAAISSPENVGLVAHEDIKTPADLIGKKIGFVEGSASELYMTLYFAEHGLDLAQVEKVPTTVPNMVPVFQSREIDAFFLWRPNPAAAEAAVPGAHVIAWNGDDDVYFQTNYHLFSDRLAQNSELAEAATKALLDGEALINGVDSAGIAARVAEEIQQEPESVEQSLAVFEHHIELTSENAAGLETVAEWLVGADRLPAVPDWSTFFTSDFLEAVAPDRVTLP